jgi:transcriptional regulator with XRE-family HTH domain
MSEQVTELITLSDWMEGEGMSQTALAERLGVSPSNVSRYAAGKQFPSKVTRERLEEIMGASLVLAIPV